MTFRVEVLVDGNAEGELLIVKEPISFYGEVDPDKGTLIDGRYVGGKILVSPGVKGSTVGAYVMYALAKSGHAPAAIIVGDIDPVVVAGAVLADITLARLSRESIKKLIAQTRDGCKAVLEVKGGQGFLTIEC